MDEKYRILVLLTMLLALLSPSVLSPPFPGAWPLLPPVLPVPMDGQHGRRGEQMQPLTRRSGKLMLLGLSTFARYHHLVAPKANAPQLQTCISLADPGQMSPDRGLKGQPVFQCLSLHLSSPHLLPPHLEALLSYLHCLVQICYSSNQIPLTQSHNLVLLSATPRATMYQGRSPGIQQGGRTKSCT